MTEDNRIPEQEFEVYWSQGVNQTIKVTATDPEDAIDRTAQEIYFSLCHECNGRMDLDGDPEPLIVFDAAGDEVWEHDKQPPAPAQEDDRFREIRAVLAEDWGYSELGITDFMHDQVREAPRDGG